MTEFINALAPDELGRLRPRPTVAKADQTAPASASAGSQLPRRPRHLPPGGSSPARPDLRQFPARPRRAQQDRGSAYAPSTTGSSLAGLMLSPRLPCRPRPLHAPSRWRHDGAGSGGADAAPGRRRPRDDQPRRGRHQREPADALVGQGRPTSRCRSPSPRRSRCCPPGCATFGCRCWCGTARRRPGMSSRQAAGRWRRGVGRGRPDRAGGTRVLARDIPRAGEGEAARGPAGVARWRR